LNGSQQGGIQVGKTLVISEKPSVARDIANALGGFTATDDYLESDQYVVTWAVGHLLELLEPEELDPKYKRWLLEDLPIIPEKFSMKPKSGVGDRLRTIGKLFKRKDITGVINACDAGREGEMIYRELAQHFQCDKPTQRLWLQSMTADAIRTGFKQLRPGEEFDGLGDAAFCRSESDWLIGMNATRVLTKRMKTRTETTAWSAGRVQTPTLALLAEREVEYLTHRPEPFWRIVAKFKAPDHSYEATWFDPKFKAQPDSPRKDDWITDAEKLEAILQAVQNQDGEASETRKPKKEIAPQLFDLTSLQREANRRFGYSARRTLQAAQRLYEGHKALTYPRTDSKYLPNDYKQHVQSVLSKLSTSGTEYTASANYLKKAGLLNQGRVFDDSKVSDHFAIIPTEQIPHSLEGDDLRIYDLVMRRFLAAFYRPAVWVEVERLTEVAKHWFKTRSRYLTDLGWYEVYGKESGEERSLPPLNAAGRKLEEALAKGLSGEDLPAVQSYADTVTVKNLEAVSEADQTRPPARLTEARILSLMENAGEQVKDDEQLSEVMKGKGLGTPATRADILENLIMKQYARRADKALRATTKGILLIDLLRRTNIDRLASARLTGEMEMHLQEVEQGKRKRQEFMEEIFTYARDVVERGKTFEYRDLYATDPPLGLCPTCKAEQVFEQSRFYTCAGNGGKDIGCNFIIWKERSGRYIDRVTVTELLRDGSTQLLDGFLTSQGKGYKGTLVLTADGLELIPEGSEGKTGGSDEIDPTAAPLAPCPRKPDGCRVFETSYNYRCEANCLEPGGRRKIGVTLPKQICQREISAEEATQFFLEGKTAEFPDFISRFGRPFAASLVLQDTGRHGFEFKPREGKPGSPGPRKSAAKAKSKAKKTVAKTAAKKTTATKKVAATAGETATTKKAAVKAKPKKAAVASETAATKAPKAKATATKAAPKKAAPKKAEAPERELAAVGAGSEVKPKPKARINKKES
jgi:DNA topoisomerase-3